MNKIVLAVMLAMGGCGVGSIYAGQLNQAEIKRVVETVYQANPRINPQISQRFTEKIIEVESHGNPEAVSRTGARGLMQVMPETFKEVSRNDFEYAFNPYVNVSAGTAYLSRLWGYCARNCSRWNKMNNTQRLSLVAAAYNGGQGRLNKKGWRIERMPKETRDYVKRVIRNYQGRGERN